MLQVYREFLVVARKRTKRVLRLLAKGKSQSEVARSVGLSRQRVNQILYPQIRKAHHAIHQKTKAGKLPKASVFKCVDCGAKAVEYDHRDYSKKLVVEPVCRRCHVLRGPGKK